MDVEMTANDYVRMAKQARADVRRTRPRHFVREWREYRELTQEELADAIGKSRGLIAQIESGETKLTEDVIYDLENAFRCAPGDIFRVNPLADRQAVDVNDIMRDASPEMRAEILGFARGVIRR